MKNRSKEIGHIFLIAFGMHIVLYCLVFGIRTLNIFYTDWMIENEYDLGLNCIGTLFFVRSKWILPNIGLMDNLNFPYYKSVVYYDTIPILSIFLKLFRDFLPKRFQFFGLWEWFSFAMQGGLGACCIYKFIKSKWACVVGCLLFSTQLCCLNNFYREIPLSSHWVLLCAFLVALYYNQLKSKGKVLACTGVMALTMFVQTAFLPMVLCILFFRIAAEIFIQKNFRTVWQGGAAMVSGGLGIVLSAWLLGLFHGSTSLSGGGLGTKGIRLDSFVNPQGFSLLFGGFRANDALYNYRPEANLTLAYIGTGVIILLTLCTLGG